MYLETQYHLRVKVLHSILNFISWCMSYIPFLSVCSLCAVHIHDGVSECIRNCAGVGFLLKQNEDIGVLIAILILMLDT